MTIFVNLTGEPVKVRQNDGVVEFNPTDVILFEKRDGFLFYRGVTPRHLPAPRDDVFYIVTEGFAQEAFYYQQRGMDLADLVLPYQAVENGFTDDDGELIYDGFLYPTVELMELEEDVDYDNDSSYDDHHRTLYD